MSDRALSLADAQLRALRIQSQGLDGSSSAAPPVLVAGTGFVRTLGGVDAYLALHARNRELHRDELDDCLVDGSLQVVPAVRGCIYLVRQQDAGHCLRIADQLSATRTARELEKVGVLGDELAAVAEAALTALGTHGPMTTDVLRKAMPDDTVRSLGDAGKKVGISSPLPAALRRLEFDGRIGRMPEGNRLDTERYLWRRTKRSPFAAAKVPDDPARLGAWLLGRFLACTGAATLQQFRAWSGLSAAVAKAAAASVEHAVVQREDGSPMLAVPDLEERLGQLTAARSACAMLPAMDNLTHLVGGAQDLVDPRFLDLVVPSWGRRKPVALRDATNLAYRPLIADGQLAGFWEYDPDAGVAVPFCFAKISKAAQLLVEDLSGAVSSLLRDELGHGRSFSLDTDDALRDRIAKLRTLTPSAGRPGAVSGRPTERPRVASARRPPKKPRSRPTTTSKSATRKA